MPEPIVGTAFFPGRLGLWNPAATGPLTLRKWQQGRMVGWHVRYAPCGCVGGCANHPPLRPRRLTPAHRDMEHGLLEAVGRASC